MVTYFIPRTSGGGSTTPTAEEIAQAVWDAQLDDHNVAGSFGKLVKKIMRFILLNS